MSIELENEVEVTATGMRTGEENSKLAQQLARVPLKHIKRTGGTQNRVALDEQVVTDYTEAMLAGAVFPPVVVFGGQDGDDVFWLADGFHRVEAASRAGLETIGAEVKLGTLEDAQWYSYAANKQHGLRRSTADKRKSITSAFLHPLGQKMSDRQIADHVGVDHKTVAVVRSQMIASGEIPQSSERTGLDGRTYTVPEREPSRQANYPVDSNNISSAGASTQQPNNSPQNWNAGVNTTYGTPSPKLVEAFRSGAAAQITRTDTEPGQKSPAGFEEIVDDAVAINQVNHTSSSNQVPTPAQEEARAKQEADERLRAVDVTALSEQVRTAAEARAGRFAQAVENQIFLHATILTKGLARTVANQLVARFYDAITPYPTLEDQELVSNWLRSHELSGTHRDVENGKSYPTLWIDQAFDDEGATNEGVIAMAVRMIVECTIILWGRRVQFNPTHLEMVNHFAKETVLRAGSMGRA